MVAITGLIADVVNMLRDQHTAITYKKSAHYEKFYVKNVDIHTECHLYIIVANQALVRLNPHANIVIRKKANVTVVVHSVEKK